MKRIFYLPIVALAAVMMFACGGNGDSRSVADTASVKEKVEAVVDSAKADSIAFLLGSLVGNDLAADFLNSESDTSGTTIDRKDYLNGLKVALSDANTSASFTLGVQAAHDILLKFKDFEKYGVEINREIFLKAIEKQLRADSVSEADLAAANTAYNELLQRIYTTTPE